VATHRLTLPCDEIQVGAPRPFNDDKLAGIFKDIFEFMTPLSADIDFLAQGRIGDPGDTAAVVGMEGEGEQEGAGATLCLRFSEHMVYNSHRHGRSFP